MNQVRSIKFQRPSLVLPLGDLKRSFKITAGTIKERVQRKVAAGSALDSSLIRADNPLLPLDRVIELQSISHGPRGGLGPLSLTGLIYLETCFKNLL